MITQSKSSIYAVSNTERIATVEAILAVPAELARFRGERNTTPKKATVDRLSEDRRPTQPPPQNR